MALAVRFEDKSGGALGDAEYDLTWLLGLALRDNVDGG